MTACITFTNLTVHVDIISTVYIFHLSLTLYICTFMVKDRHLCTHLFMGLKYDVNLRCFTEYAYTVHNQLLYIQLYIVKCHNKYYHYNIVQYED